MNLVIFHYHLLPGGVTSVIRQSVASLQGHSKQVSRVQVVAGTVPPEMPPFAGVETVCLPEIGYTPAPLLGGVLLKERAQRLAETLVKRFADDDAVWWVHNYHLGKNPIFTEALLQLASSANAPWMVLQPHDFPESGRYNNLSVLDRTVSLPLYPLSGRVRYALINQRDCTILREAGVPDTRLFVVENPILAPAQESSWGEDRRGMRALMFPDADPLHPTLLYPVRSIRRKNVLEAGVLPRLVDIPLRVVVTLPGVSRQEKSYSAVVEGAFNSGIIPGEFGTGVRRPDLRLERLASACDAVVSSSVQEGFGYLFVQALQWGLPLLGRCLETAPLAGGLYDGYPAYFYDSLVCPLEASERSRLLERYRAKLRRLRRFLGAEAAEKLEEELSGTLRKEGVDFSYLDTPLQLRVLAAAAHVPDFRSEMRMLNPEIARRLSILVSERPSARIQAVDKRFGPVAYAAGVDRVLSSFDTETNRHPDADPVLVQSRVRAAFARAEHMRLLYD